MTGDTKPYQTVRNSGKPPEKEPDLTERPGKPEARETLGIESEPEK